jgi:hypothetical protein
MIILLQEYENYLPDKTVLKLLSLNQKMGHSLN